MSEPSLIDNLDGNTLAQALNGVLKGNPSDIDGSIGRVSSPDELRIATAYFSPSGFAHIANSLKPIATVRLMLGTDLAANRPQERRQLGESTSAYKRRCLKNGLNSMDKALQRERDSLPFSQSSSAALRALIDILKAGNLEVRRYEEKFLHAKAYIACRDAGSEEKPEGVTVGSSNLTSAGLVDNLELNLCSTDQPIVERATQWFDDLWDNAEPYDLATVFERALLPCQPWEIFIRVLWQLYGSEIDKDAKTDGDLPLTSFQKHGVARALRLIDETGGAIVADEVGLGKTFIAGELLQIYHQRRQRALLICPASLRDSTWKQFLTRFELFVECLSFEELANDIQKMDSGSTKATQTKLQRNLDEYQFVIVDEAHNYRNPNAKMRAGVLRRLMYGKPRDLLLLTATPVNNSLWDLYHLIRYFVRQDAHFVGKGIISIRDRFLSAMREDPASLNPDLLLPDH